MAVSVRHTIAKEIGGERDGLYGFERIEEKACVRSDVILSHLKTHQPSLYRARLGFLQDTIPSSIDEHRGGGIFPPSGLILPPFPPTNQSITSKGATPRRLL